MLFRDDEQLVELFNGIINSESCKDRVSLANEIASDVGRWMMLSPLLIEQLVNKLDIEIEFMATKKCDNPILDVLLTGLRESAVEKAQRTVGLIKAFLDIRAQFRDAIMRHCPDNGRRIPE